MSDSVKRMDPGRAAPPVAVDRDPGRDQPGHGRTLPLVGGARPHQYDVVYANGTRRVYADTPGDVLAAVIPGYDGPAKALSNAEAEAEALIWDEDGQRVQNPDPAAVNAARDRVQTAFADAFVARADHAAHLREQLQQRETDHARGTGDWDDLDDEAREQCEASARGEVPVGVIYEVPEDDGVVERGGWPFEVPRLVISRGDYGLFVPEGTEEPESMVGIDVEGHEVIPVVRFPRNMVILDPTEENLYLESLEVAGLVEATIRPIDLPDDQYVSAVELGAKMREAGEDATVPSV